MKLILPLAALVVSIAAAALLAGCRPVTPPPQTSPPQTPQITITNPEDTVSIERVEGVTVIDIISPRGIGAAQVRLSPAQADGPIQVRFHLQGLEQATLNNGAAQLTVSLSSHPPYPTSQTLTTDGTTHSLSEGDALWAEVELAPDDAAASLTLPLTSGAIIVTLPAAFVDIHHPDLSLNWIDFFR